MAAEVEPRRSVRTTKGQHTKSFDELEATSATKRRQGKRGKKGQQAEQDQEPEEVIRCVCGANEQDEDSGEAWIACEKCFVWQHNVCVGVSSFEDEIPENYWCEQCKPQNHKELLEGMAKGEKPWEARRKAHEEAVAEKKKRKGGRKAKGKRGSDSKDEIEKSKPSPGPEPGVKKESTPTLRQGKRKSREDSHDTDGKTPKLRRVSDQEPAAAPSSYTPPKDIAAAIADLPDGRVVTAKALKKSLVHVLGSISKSEDLSLPEGDTLDTLAERFALQIERAVYDTHPETKGQKEYNQQIRSLAFNLKNNPEICHSLLSGAHTPATVAVLTSEQMASTEMQRQTAEMRAKAEKASILYTADTGPRMRRTHKGEEYIEEDGMAMPEVPPPMPGGSRRGADREQPIKRESTDRGESQEEGRASQQHSPSQPSFDISKVFSSVQSPPIGHPRRPSAPVLQTNGPGIDPDVDRLLQDDNESPPYSPTEEAQDPDVVWRGSLAMSSVADFRATAKHIGGANFSVIERWSKLIPKRMTVAGRIQQQSAIEYLCSLRYSDLTDVVVVSLSPESPESQPEFNNLINYFANKQRYGVVGDKVAGNVRDTYLVPVPAGTDDHPEFMLNLADNYIPKSRTEPMLLAVFVYRNDPDQLDKFRKDSQASTAQGSSGSPMPPNAAVSTPTPSGYGQRSNSVSGPGFSPATPQHSSFSPQPPTGLSGGGPPLQTQTPVPIPQPPHLRAQNAAPAQPPVGSAQSPSAAAPGQPAPAGGQLTEQQKFQAQKEGEALAEEVLGKFIKVSTVQFLLPQAFQMSRREWEVVRDIYEHEPRAQEDLQFLGALLEKRGSEKGSGSAAPGEAAAQKAAA